MRQEAIFECKNFGCKTDLLKSKAERGADSGFVSCTQADHRRGAYTELQKLFCREFAPAEKEAIRANGFHIPYSLFDVQLVPDTRSGTRLKV